MSMSSKCPLATSSGLPSRNSISPFSLRRRRSSTSMNSSAGTAKNTSSPHRDAEHAGDLRVVAAAVRRAGMRVGQRVVGGSEAVELADEGEAGAGGIAAEAALDAGQGEAGLRGEADLTHLVGDDRGGLAF